MVYAECAPIRCYPFQKFLFKTIPICVLGATVIFGALAAYLLSVPQRVSRSEWELVIELSAMTGAVAIVVAVSVGLLVRRTALRPIVIELDQEQLACRLAVKKNWCPLNELNPQVAMSELEFVGVGGTALFRPTLPLDIRDDCFGVWLSLSYRDRHRWALLESYAGEHDAMDGVMSWADRLQLNSEDHFSTRHPPQKLQFV